MRSAQSNGLRQYGLALLGLLLTTTAGAAPGDHIRAGDFVITPDLDLGFEYRSNAFRADTNPQSTGAFRVAPGLSITAETPQVVFGLNAEYGLRKFLFLTNPDGALSSDEISRQITRLDRFNEFDVGANIHALRDRQVSFKLSDNILLRNNPNDSVPDADDPYATQLRNSLRGTVPIRPGPALTIEPSGFWNYATFFVPSSLDQREAFNTRNSYGPQLDVAYNFLPRTAFVFQGQFVWNSWVDNNPTIGSLSFPTPNSRQLRLQVGIQGRITERLRIITRAGYGYAWYDAGANLPALDGLLLALQGDYDVTEQHKVSLGYRKNFVDSFFTNSAGHNTIYARWQGAYGKRVTSRLEYALRFENYTGAVERNDIVNQLNLGISVKAQEWVAINLNGGWLGRTSTADEVEYNDVRALLGATFQY